jgi:hypothetical protein
MELVHKWHTRDKPRSVYAAVTHVLDDPDSYFAGVAESAQGTADRAARMLAEVISMLHANGALTDQNVLALLPNFDRAPGT